MEIPFTQSDFLGVFGSYNNAIQPAQIISYLLGIVAVAVAIRGSNRAGTLVLSILAVFWAWTGLVYHIGFFSAINGAAYIFGGLFILQSLLLVYAAFRIPPLVFQPGSSATTIVGTVFIVYSLMVYPVLNMLFGHHYPQMPVFGVTPCPMTIFTFGMLLWSTTQIPYYLIVIPTAWSFIGLSAAINLQIYEDFGLIVAGVLGALLIVINNRRLGRR
ncbi:MAG: DUF6064 family protein [Gammaproteobacteria bacterium]|jgi:hypothetical protein